MHSTTNGCAPSATDAVSALAPYGSLLPTARSAARRPGIAARQQQRAASDQMWGRMKLRHQTRGRDTVTRMCGARACIHEPPSGHGIREVVADERKKLSSYGSGAISNACSTTPRNSASVRSGMCVGHVTWSTSSARTRMPWSACKEAMAPPWSGPRARRTRLTHSLATPSRQGAND